MKTSKLIPTLPFNYVTLLREEAIDLDLDLQYYEHMFILVQDNSRDLKDKYIFNSYMHTTRRHLEEIKKHFEAYYLDFGV